MVIVSISNSYSKVQGLTVAEEKGLRNHISYTVGSYAGFYSGGFGPKKVSLLNKRGEFPTGLIYRVLDWLITGDVEFQVQDKRRMPPACAITGLQPQGYPPYPQQTAALKAALKAHRGIISMPTGTGKSKVIDMIATELRRRVLVVVPSLEIKKQLAPQLEWNKLVRVENIDNPELEELTDFDVLIIDEAHHVAAKTYRKLNKKAWNKIFFRFFLTATPFRNDTEETLLFESIAGEVIYQLDYQSAVKDGLIVPVVAHYIEVIPTNTDAYSWAEVYSELVTKNDARNLLLADVLLATCKPTLCLVKEVAHGKRIAELSGVPFVNGTDEESRQYIKDFNSGKIDKLIGTEGILGEGVDTKPCEIVIIAGLGKAKSAFMQKVGRAVRRHNGKESAKIILIKDISHKFTINHFNAQKKILLDEYGVKPTKLELA